MTVKRIALLGLASVATLGMSISMAGGPAACAPAAQMSGIYIGVDVGAFYNATYSFDASIANGTRNITIGAATITSASSSSTSNVPWGWTASGLIGYQFDNNWALQFGYIWNQTQKLNIDNVSTTHNGGIISVTTEDATFKMESYNLYLAVKGMLPLWDDFSAYMMIGPAWTHLKQKVSYATTTGANHSTSDDFWSPVGAVGVAWNIDEAFSVNLQYMYILSDFNTSGLNDLRTAYRSTQRVTVGANYLFAM